jgi:large subunit ribosomal protein L13
MQKNRQKTTLAAKETVEKNWFIVDAENKILGRLASKIAMVLMGKHRPEYTANVDTGDFVIVTNAGKVRLTGKKAETKTYEHYTYHVGGRKVFTFADIKSRKPELIITQAVRCMLPKNPLGRHMLTKLKVYRGSEHPHAAQTPNELNLN